MYQSVHFFKLFPIFATVWGVRQTIVLGSCSDTFKKWSVECPNRMLYDEMQYEKSKGQSRWYAMYDNYESEKNIERKCMITQSVYIYNELKKYMKDMNELEEHNLVIV